MYDYDMQAIILDGQLKSALATVRALGEKGVLVSVGAERPTAMSLHSRYAQNTFVYPSPYTQQRACIDAVRAEALRMGGKPVVYAFSDATFLSLYMYRSELADVVTIAFPDEKSMEIAFDKAATYSLARVSGVPTITTYTPQTRTEVQQVGEMLTYPAVVKTRRSVTWHEGVGTFGSVQFVSSAPELEKVFFEIFEKTHEYPLIQVLVRGEEYGVEMLAEKGNVYARVVHHRLRSLSPTGGASVLKETMDESDLKRILIEYAEILVQKLAWSGPIMVEFKVDADTREPYLMEINGRFWGSLPLSIFAGVNMPCLYFNTLTKHEYPEAIVEGRNRVISMHFAGDVRHLLRVLFARDAMRPVLYPKRLHTIRNFLFPPRSYSDVFSLQDPKPVLMEIIDILKR